MWNIKGYHRNSTHNIFPIHWRIRFIYNVVNWGALWFTRSYLFLKPSPDLGYSSYGQRLPVNGMWSRTWIGLITRHNIGSIQYLILRTLAIYGLRALLSLTEKSAILLPNRLSNFKAMGSFKLPILSLLVILRHIRYWKNFNVPLPLPIRTGNSKFAGEIWMTFFKYN